MASPSYIGSALTSTQASIGLTTAETGVVRVGMSVTHENPMVEFRDRFGGRIGWAHKHDAALAYSLTADLTLKASGLNIAQFGAAATLANKDYFASAGATYNTLDYTTCNTFLTGASMDQQPGSPRTVSFEYLRPYNGGSFTV